jgi:hypothetical protein
MEARMDQQWREVENNETAFRVIDKAAHEDPTKSWLSSKGKVTAGVIDEVRHLREASSDGKPPITDRDIYLHFRKKLETTGMTDKDKDRFQIVDALMNGVRGKLPF